MNILGVGTWMTRLDLFKSNDYKICYSGKENSKTKRTTNDAQWWCC